jgi:hypothetical protein
MCVHEVLPATMRDMTVCSNGDMRPLTSAYGLIMRATAWTSFEAFLKSGTGLRSLHGNEMPVDDRDRLEIRYVFGGGLTDSRDCDACVLSPPPSSRLVSSLCACSSDPHAIRLCKARRSLL